MRARWFIAGVAIATLALIYLIGWAQHEGIIVVHKPQT